MAAPWPWSLSLVICWRRGRAGLESQQPFVGRLLCAELCAAGYSGVGVPLGTLRSCSRNETQRVQGLLVPMPRCRGRDQGLKEREEATLLAGCTVFGKPANAPPERALGGEAGGRWRLTRRLVGLGPSSSWGPLRGLGSEAQYHQAEGRCAVRALCERPTGEPARQVVVKWSQVSLKVWVYGSASPCTWCLGVFPVGQSQLWADRQVALPAGAQWIRM